MPRPRLNATHANMQRAIPARTPHRRVARGTLPRGPRRRLSGSHRRIQDTVAGPRPAANALLQQFRFRRRPTHQHAGPKTERPHPRGAKAALRPHCRAIPSLSVSSVTLLSTKPGAHVSPANCKRCGKPTMNERSHAINLPISNGHMAYTLQYIQFNVA